MLILHAIYTLFYSLNMHVCAIGRMGYILYSAWLITVRMHLWCRRTWGVWPLWLLGRSRRSGRRIQARRLPAMLRPQPYTGARHWKRRHKETRSVFK